MDYEKKYKESLALMVDCIPDEDGYVHVRPQDIFPELKQSGDEKIKKEIINYFAKGKEYLSLCSIGKDDILAWLEKQGEQKTIDKVKPKFKVGEWVVQENIGVYKVIEICESWYEVIDNEDKHYSIGFDKKCMCHLWTIDDVRDGDVLTNGDCPCIFKSINEENAMFVYCGINAGGDFATKSKGKDNIWDDEPENYCPATKEQRDLLFAKMKETGYEWDAKKKELKKIEQSKLTEFEDAVKDMMDDYRDAIDANDATTEEVKERAAYMLSLISHKPADWSEEDEKELKQLTRWLVWLKSLKQRIGG